MGMSTSTAPSSITLFHCHKHTLPAPKNPVIKVTGIFLSSPSVFIAIICYWSATQEVQFRCSTCKCAQQKKKRRALRQKEPLFQILHSTTNELGAIQWMQMCQITLAGTSPTYIIYLPYPWSWHPQAQLPSSMDTSIPHQGRKND